MPGSSYEFWKDDNRYSSNFQIWVILVWEEAMNPVSRIGAGHYTMISPTKLIGWVMIDCIADAIFVSTSHALSKDWTCSGLYCSWRMREWECVSSYPPPYRREIRKAGRAKSSDFGESSQLIGQTQPGSFDLYELSIYYLVLTQQVRMSFLTMSETEWPIVQ